MMICQCGAAKKDPIHVERYVTGLPGHKYEPRSPFDEDPHFLMGSQDVWYHIERYHPSSRGPRDIKKLITPLNVEWSRSYLLLLGVDVDYHSDCEIVANAMHHLLHAMFGEDHR